MRSVRNLFLFGMTAVAAMAFAVPGAFAQTVEVQGEPGAGHCDPFCDEHGTSVGAVELEAHSPLGEQPLSNCNTEFDGEIDENGEGAVINHQLSGAQCVVQACGEETGSNPWPFHLNELGVSTDEEEALEVTFCIEPIVPPHNQTFCTIDAHVEDIGGHEYVVTANESPCHGSGENPFVNITGQWLSEDHDVEVVHLDD